MLVKHVSPIVAVALALVCATTQAATTLNLSDNGPPDAEKNAVHLFASNLKRLIEEKTDGKITIKLYPRSHQESRGQFI